MLDLTQDRMNENHSFALMLNLAGGTNRTCANARHRDWPMLWMPGSQERSQDYQDNTKTISILRATMNGSKDEGKRKDISKEFIGRVE
jgi:hypothetical protein